MSMFHECLGCGSEFIPHGGDSETHCARCERDDLRADVLKARNERDEARRGWIESEAWSLFEGGRVPEEIAAADWWKWNHEDPRYYHALAARRWGDHVADYLFPLKWRRS